MTTPTKRPALTRAVLRGLSALEGHTVAMVQQMRADARGSHPPSHIADLERALDYIRALVAWSNRPHHPGSD